MYTGQLVYHFRCSIGIFRNNGKNKLLNFWQLVKSNYTISPRTSPGKVDQARNISLIARDDYTVGESESRSEDDSAESENEYDIACTDNGREGQVLFRRERMGSF